MRIRRVSVLVLTIPAVLLGTVATASPALAAPCDTSSTSLGNGGFETPVVAADTYTLFPAASVSPWQTTDGSGEIEIWGTGFNGVPAYEGNAFAELNANTPGTLYQDVVSTPGATMTWSLAHRGRAGDDTMQVLIGDANAADVNGAAGWDYISADLTDGTSDWGTHAADYVVPAGQTCTRLAFRAVSSVGGASFGNFLDVVAFSTTIPAPTPTPTPAATATNAPIVITPPPTDTVKTAPTEPGSSALGAGAVMALLLASALGSGAARRRRAKRAP